MSGHSLLGPSSSSRWLECPGSIRLTRTLEEDDIPSVSSAAFEGTVAHEILADRLENMQWEANHEDEEINNSVQLALDYVKQRTDELDELYGNVHVHIETYISLKFLGIEDMDGGTGDLLIYCKNLDDSIARVELYDFKHGAGTFVEAENNTQLLMYGVGVIEDLGVTSEEDIPIVLGIIQPRHFFGDDKVRLWELTPKEIYTWREEILVPRAEACHEEDAPFIATETNCKWCPARAKCPALAELTLELAKQDFASISSHEEIAELPLDTKQKILEASLILPQFFEDVKRIAFKEMKEGSLAYSKTHKLVKTIVRARWSSDAEERLYPIIPQKRLYKKVLRAPKEILSALQIRYRKDRAEEIFNDVRYTPAPDLTIAPISDRRKALSPESSAELDFAEIPEEESDG